ncbi:MAG: hypothetical protein A2W05_00035 [Candidatus Schekmanbacteria bacterium RBG_16_38_10]|uniref:Gfo/Idh/MocA-like oxidoreductase C-terminal domain-containing protein n=1 Tax=Candidatus Schekmanbacteria bacterium RBG_16_38_10 TaxID=1817879 RepID=A0A1F7S1J9_9BACT|nr:MAG: hypothetical protein A2W05_00035 [Candidatus Schekmanbacteria bacterium RBG_16_38_10]
MYKYIYIEKPLAQSMADCDKMANIIERNNVSVAVGFYNDFLILTKNLDEIAKEHGMGKLLKISSQGGALCLSTNGAHFIDLASVLFKSRPKEVLGKVNTTIKNPRGMDYLIYDGLGYVTYENDKELLLSFNNRSLNSPEMVLHFEYGYIEASHDSEYLRVMGFKSNSKDRPKYRCDRPVELARINNNNDFNKLFDRIFYNLLNGGVYCSIDRAMQDMQVLLSILISDKIGRRLELPIRSDNYYYHEKFPIT